MRNCRLRHWLVPGPLGGATIMATVTIREGAIHFCNHDDDLLSSHWLQRLAEPFLGVSVHQTTL